MRASEVVGAGEAERLRWQIGAERARHAAALAVLRADADEAHDLPNVTYADGHTRARTFARLRAREVAEWSRHRETAADLLAQARALRGERP